MKHHKINALFFSTIAPGYIAGGSLCSLAYLQAVDELHNGNVTYIGPPFTTPECRNTMKIHNNTVFIPERTFANKILHALTLHSVDRLSPIAEKIIIDKAGSRESNLVYINGERCGRLARLAKGLGLKSIAIFQNFAPEYLKNQPISRTLLNPIIKQIAFKNCRLAYKYSDFRLFLTEHDRANYMTYIGTERQNSLSRGDMYFGDKEKLPVSVPKKRDNEFVICINANMSMKMNEAGLLSFINNIWPVLRSAEPSVKLILAGRYPLQSIKTAAASFSDIEIYERPERAQMEDIFSRTSLCIASSDHGSGIKLRIAESLRRGIPVLAVPHSTRGYEMISPDVLKTYTSTNEAVSAVREMINKPSDRLKNICLSEYDKYFSFSKGVSKLNDVINIVLNGKEKNGSE